MSKVNVVCTYCANLFLIEVGEYNRKLKKKTRFYCSRSCTGKDNISHLKPYLGQIHPNFKRSKDEFSEFREHLRRANRRMKEVNITLIDLKDQWNLQQGKCVYTKVQLKHPTTGSNNPLYTASLDRINSTVGYCKGNIQFVSMASNLAKCSMTHEQMLEFCEIIKQSN